MTVLDLEKGAYKFAESFSKKDIQSLGKLFDNEISLFDPALKWVKGKKALMEILEKQFKETKKVQYRVERFFQDGHTSILEFVLTFDELVLYGVDFIEWKEDKIREIRCYYNPPDK